MAAKRFHTAVRRAPGVAIIDLDGEINAEAEAALNAASTEVLASDAGAILLNFLAVDYINSTGIALIVAILTQTRNAHRKLLAYGLSEHYLEIFEITRLADFIQIFASEEQALAAIRVGDTR